MRLKIIDAEFNYVEVWLTDQGNRPLEVGDNVNITLIVG